MTNVILSDTACENYSYLIDNIVYQDVNTITWSSSGDGYFNGTGEKYPVYHFSSNDKDLDTIFFYVQANSLSPCVHIDHDTLMLRLYHEPEPSFVCDNQEGCSPLPVHFTNTSTGEELTYQWDFGNGLKSDEEDPGEILFQQGRIADTIYTVTLEATNRCNSSSTSLDVIVKPLPIADFGMNVSWGCSPEEIYFSNVSTGLPDTHLWKWGDGKEPSMEENPASHIFETGDYDTTYTITLITENECGLDSMQKSVIIFPNTVDAFFETDTTFGCAPLEVSFTNYSRGVLGDEPFLNWSWNFGDGNITDELHPVHTFENPGTYEVSLYVNDTCSYDTSTTVIDVMGAPHVEFATDKIDYCEHDTVNVSPFNMSIDEIGSVIWDFGDGTRGYNFTDNHIYDTAGEYTITFTAKDIVNGCTSSISKDITVYKAPAAAFSIPENDGCQPLHITFLNETEGGDYYSWDFGNGNKSNDIDGQQLFTEAGIYNIILKARNVRGCTDTAIKTLNVYPRPKAAFESSSYQTCFPPVDIKFINLSEGADAYQWDFGNGVVSKETNPSITYSDYGEYSIKLIANNMFFCSDTSEMIFHVFHNPVADFKVDTTIGCDPFIVPFTNLSEYGVEYFWNFEDQGYSEEEEPAFTFNGEGVYTVTLKVIGQGGCVDSVIKEDFITTNPSPISDFDYSRVDEIDTIYFHNYSSGAIAYIWDFGDGEFSEEENPWHSYKHYGKYSVSLTTINEYDCKDIKTDSINFELIKGLFLPDALSPGNISEDIGNFKAVGIGLKKYHLLIYDTWGNLIWETTELYRGMPAEAWDGTFNGKPLDPDVYVWHLKEATFKDGSEYKGERYGTITLIR
ncbi:MAG: PKD domain-containing protein [Bacteroidales bacterium]